MIINKSSDPHYLNNILPNLGKSTHTGWSYTKSFLSFDPDGSWKVLKLNPIQIIARKLFGFYRETHLKQVILDWNAYQAKHGCVSPELNTRLAMLWSKKHADKIIQPPPDIFFVGNSKIEEAEVIGICELFSDPENSKFCGKVLSEQYRDGDIILVEGIDANKALPSTQDLQTIFLAKPAEVYGWEPVGYSSSRDKLFESNIAIDNEFQYNSAMLIKLLNNVNFLTNSQEFVFKKAESGDDTNLTESEKAQLWEKLLHTTLEKFQKSIQKIEERFHDGQHSDSESIEFNIVPSLMIKFQHQYEALMQSKNKENFGILIPSAMDIYENCNKFLQKRKYTSTWTTAQNAFFQNTWNLRQQSLCNEIKRYLQMKKRVFVCAGGAHFFPNKGGSDSEVISTIMQYKFTIAIKNIKQNATYYSFDALAKKFI